MIHCNHWIVLSEAETWTGNKSPVTVGVSIGDVSANITTSGGTKVSGTVGTSSGKVVVSISIP